MSITFFFQMASKLLGLTTTTYYNNLLQQQTNRKTKYLTKQGAKYLVNKTVGYFVWSGDTEKIMESLRIPPK